MKFSGVTILQGVEFSIFPIDFEWALKQCSATALPVIISEQNLVLMTKSCSICFDLVEKTKFRKNISFDIVAKNGNSVEAIFDFV